MASCQLRSQADLPFWESVMIHLLTAIWLTPDGSITVHIYTQTVHRTTQITTEEHK